MSNNASISIEKLNEIVAIAQDDADEQGKKGGIAIADPEAYYGGFIVSLMAGLNQETSGEIAGSEDYLLERRPWFIKRMVAMQREQEIAVMMMNQGEPYSD
ncbi:hypothetical protein OR1_04085 [Geobacter sp. OR-1]|uniref:hypothetical protein n=1 Tax=Geobacter sp. OR-1 TaxID=1266765 RepID=UPI0005420C5D|nr:hypothetical protein [Geobacter sp. OR-1]GAM11767.1 hypothetical protein OR1_04085 [Geobacter sp. OR-1]